MRLNKYTFISIIIIFELLVSLRTNAVTRGNTTRVTVTCYQPVKAQCNGNPLVTADGSKIDLNRLRRGKIKWCSVSRDLLKLFPKGKPKKIWIEGLGIYEVRDVMNKRFRRRVDILVHPKTGKLIYLNNVKIKIIS